MDRGLKIALVVALVAYFVARDLRMTLIMAGTTYGANMLL